MASNRVFAVCLVSVTCVVLGIRVTEVSTQVSGTSSTRREESRTVWDGVYSLDQAERGGRAYVQACSQCHDTGEAPSVVGESFIRSWFQEDLSVPLEKIQTTMPLDDPGSLGEVVSLEILAFLLEASGFPAGGEPLVADGESLARIVVVDEGGVGGPVPDFSLVQVVGCLTQSVDGVWFVTRATEPARTRDPMDSPPADLEEAAVTPLGHLEFQLLEPLPRYDLLDHTVLTKGFLLRQQGGDRLNPTSLQTLIDRCPG